MDLRSEGQGKFDRVKKKYCISTDTLRRIHSSFVDEMEIGLQESDDIPNRKQKSSLKMQSSRIEHIPDGSEKWIFYTLDWDKSQFRILRIDLKGKGRREITSQRKLQIPDTFKSEKEAHELFDYLASYLWQEMAAHSEVNQEYEYPVGFRFSFPMHQPVGNQGMIALYSLHRVLQFAFSQKRFKFSESQSTSKFGTSKNLKISNINKVTYPLIACALTALSH